MKITWYGLKLFWGKQINGYYHINTCGKNDDRIYIGISTKPIDNQYELILFPNGTSFLFDCKHGIIVEFIVEYIKENLLEDFCEKY